MQRSFWRWPSVSYWLGVKVGTDLETRPRQSVAASAYAIRAATTEAFAAGATVPAAQVTGPVSSAASFTGALAGDVTGTQGATVISPATVTGKALPLVIDELDTSLHTLLMRELVRLFYRPEIGGGAQLIFIPHDTSPLAAPVALPTLLGQIVWRNAGGKPSHCTKRYNKSREFSRQRYLLAGLAKPASTTRPC